MSAPETERVVQAVTSGIRSFSLSPDDEFSAPSRSLGQHSAPPWKLSLPLDQSPGHMKAKTPEPPSINTTMLSIPTMNSGMARRASCPNFSIPDISLFPSETSQRLISKRPSIQVPVMSGFAPVVQQGAGQPRAPPSPILESSLESSSAVGHTGSVNISDSQVVPKQPGVLSSTMSALFVPKELPSQAEATSVAATIPSQQEMTDGALPTKPKKSYLMRRAAAMTNSDVNVMAPTSM